MQNTLERIHKSVLKFLVPLTPEDTYRTIVEEALKLVNGEYGSILLAEKGELQRVYANSPILFKIKPRPKGIMFNVFKSLKPVILNFTDIKEVHPEIREIKGPRSDIIIPLSYRNQSTGVLTIISKRYKSFNESDLDILKYFGPMASLAIRKNQLYSEARQAIESRDLFMSMAAHELRTPLTTIGGYIQLLLTRFSSKDSQEAGWIKELYRESVRLKNLIDEFLQANKIRSGQLKYNLEVCDINDIIKRSVDNLKFSHPDRNITITNNTSDGLDHVTGDPDKLLQVLVNVVENALKYSPNGKGVQIKTRYKKPCIEIQVIDQGVGILKKDLPRVFEGFYRGENSQERGMGLGLFLAKNIVEVHHGDITVRSSLNKGTTVTIKLPTLKDD